ncbi:TlpA family protein disulfide reductase [Microscilla marina]|uniref:TlpA family protein disulfide reductase n=1 Tax=Microscilla marina TaxID=1027 RepID=UPI0005D46B88|nr:TlpA disulfide reductase family protein [Microscilla marina]
MKTSSALYITCLLVVAVSFSAKAQKTTKGLPNVTIKTLDGNSLSTQALALKGHFTVVSFWATWCKPCIQELSAIHDVYPDWQEDMKVKLIAISVDDARSRARAKSLVKGKRWEFETYIDENGDLKRAMNVLNVPHTFILNKDGEIVWQHTSYKPGDEEKYYDVLKKLNTKK